VNWGSLAFDSERQVLLAAVNHLPMGATSIPRDQFEPMRTSERYAGSEFAHQAGTPYGMRRELLASPLGLPALRRHGDRSLPSTCVETLSAGR
jgi:quinoprotein glucose dehydrogenase